MNPYYTSWQGAPGLEGHSPGSDRDFCGYSLTVTKSLIAIAAFTGTLACFAPSSKEPVASTTEQGRVNLTKLFNDTCSPCHGVDGDGGGAGTKSFNTEELFDQNLDRRFFGTVKSGLAAKGMPAFGGSFTDEEIWGLVVHIRELQAKALRAKNGSPTAVNGVYKSDKHSFRMENVVTEGLDTPWSVSWTADGKMLVTNRPGGLYVFNGGTKIAEVEGVPASVEQGQGGLMEVKVHESGWVYLSVADPAGEGASGAMTKLYRGKIVVSGSSAKWTNNEVIYEADQSYYGRSGVHFGSKIAFQGDYIFFSVGERGTNMGAQDKSTPYGKIMRLHLDGSVPSDNPVTGNAMWTYGHRNPQGLAFGLDGTLWDTEHGPRGGDEINVISKGDNYGWPVVAFSINYSDSPFRVPWPTDDGLDVHQPAYRWLPSVGSSGLTVADGDMFSNWKGDLIAGGLSGSNVDRYTMEDGEMVEREELLHGIGRVRDIQLHKDGSIYLAINGPDKIVRLVAAD